MRMIYNQSNTICKPKIFAEENFEYDFLKVPFKDRNHDFNLLCKNESMRIKANNSK